MTSWKILQGDCCTVLETLPAASIHCIVTSPPYYGMRDYGVAGQIGCEASPAAYIDTLVRVFDAAKRVLRHDGVLWLNLGDGYVTRPGNGRGGEQRRGGTPPRSAFPKAWPGLTPKNLLGLPWRIALALQAAGWYLRAEITWCKAAPLPESVRDRPTSATEKIFLLTQSVRYFYDQDALRVPLVKGLAGSSFTTGKTGVNSQGRSSQAPRVDHPLGRNLWNYWVLGPEPFPGAHHAVFPTEIPRRAILLGTSAQGCCAQCGAPWTRLVQRQRLQDGAIPITGGWPQNAAGQLGAQGTGHWRIATQATTQGWAPTCQCGAPVVPCTVLDPFCGAGTTGLVARQLQRRFLGIELHPDYCVMARQRLAQDVPRSTRSQTTTSLRAPQEGAGAA